MIKWRATSAALQNKHSKLRMDVLIFLILWRWGLGIVKTPLRTYPHYTTPALFLLPFTHMIRAKTCVSLPCCPHHSEKYQDLQQHFITAFSRLKYKKPYYQFHPSDSSDKFDSVTEYTMISTVPSIVLWIRGRFPKSVDARQNQYVKHFIMPVFIMLDL